MARSKSLSKQRPLFLESVKGSWTSGSLLIKEATILIRMESSLFTWQQADNLDMNSSSWVSKSRLLVPFQNHLCDDDCIYFTLHGVWLRLLWGESHFGWLRFLFSVLIFRRRKKNFCYWLFGLLQGSVCAEEMTLTELHTSLPRL